MAHGYAPPNAIFKHETGKRSCKKVKAPEPELRGPFGPKGYIRPATFLAPILAPQLRLSIPASGRRNKPGLFRSKRPINGALCFRYSLGLRRGSASFRMVRVERDRPFPDMPPDTLNDAVLDSAIFQADLRTCGSRGGLGSLFLVALPAAARDAVIAPWAAQRDGAFLAIGSAAQRSAPCLLASGRGKPLAKLTPLNAFSGRNRWRVSADRRSHPPRSRNASMADTAG